MLEVKNMSAKKGRFELKSLDFTVSEGEIVGLIGRNGSGKTTTLQCLSGQYPLSGGSFLFNGKRLWQMTETELESLAMLNAGESTFKGSGRKFKLNEISSGLSREFSDFNKEKFNNLIQKLELDPVKTVSSLSLGQYELFLFAVAISQRAKLIMVDETLSSLDPISKENLFSVLRQYSEDGGSVLITSHILSDLDKICDRLLFIENGSIIKTATPEDLKETFAVIDVTEEMLECIPEESILLKEKNNLSYCLLVKKAEINPVYLNRPSELEEIVTALMKLEKEKTVNEN